MAKYTDTSFKRMSSYEIFAWQDACQIANYINAQFEIEVVKKTYEEEGIEQVKNFEKKNLHLITEFIGKTEYARLSYLDKISKNSPESSVTLFLILSVIALVRVVETIKLRDSYSRSLAPGLSNRVTTKNLYTFTNGIIESVSYDWPSEVFDTIGVYIDDEDDIPDFEYESQADPIPPAPTEAPQHPPGIDFCIFLKKSDKFGLSKLNAIVPLMDTSAVKDLWYLAATNEEHSKLLLRLFEDKPNGTEVSRTLIEILGFTYDGEAINVIISKALFKEYPQLQVVSDDLTGRVFEAAPHVSRTAESKWANKYLEDLQREFVLINEPLPHIREFNSFVEVEKFSTIELSHADTTDSWNLKRELLIKHTLHICSLRNKDFKSITTILPKWEGAEWENSNVSDPKLFKQLSKYYLEGRSTAEGRLLFFIADAIRIWNDKPEKYKEVEESIARNIIEFLSTNIHRSPTYLLSRLLPDLSQSSDLVEKSLYRKFNNGFALSQLNQTWKGMCYFFWIPINLKSIDSQGIIRCIPKHLTMSKLITQELNMSLRVNLSREIYSDSNFKKRINSHWLSRSKYATYHVLDAIRHICNPSAEPPKKSWFMESQKETDNHWAFVSITTDSDDLVLNREGLNRNFTPVFLKAFQAQLDGVLVKAGLPKMIDVGIELQEFSQPMEMFDECLKIMIRNNQLNANNGA